MQPGFLPRPASDLRQAESRPVVYLEESAATRDASIPRSKHRMKEGSRDR